MALLAYSLCACFSQGRGPHTAARGLHMVKGVCVPAAAHGTTAMPLCAHLCCASAGAFDGWRVQDLLCMRLCKLVRLYGCCSMQERVSVDMHTCGAKLAMAALFCGDKCCTQAHSTAHSPACLSRHGAMSLWLLRAPMDLCHLTTYGYQLTPSGRGPALHGVSSFGV